MPRLAECVRASTVTQKSSKMPSCGHTLLCVTLAQTRFLDATFLFLSFCLHAGKKIKRSLSSFPIIPLLLLCLRCSCPSPDCVLTMSLSISLPHVSSCALLSAPPYAAFHSFAFFQPCTAAPQTPLNMALW